MLHAPSRFLLVVFEIETAVQSRARFFPGTTRHDSPPSVPKWEGRYSLGASEEDALTYYHERVEAHLRKPIDEQDWQAMLRLGYAVDALSWLGFAAFFYEGEQNLEDRAW